MRALVTGWFSLAHGEATVGDLRAGEVVRGWLDEARVDYDVATSPVFEDGVDLDELTPADYTHLVFVCGPAHGEQVDVLLDRFAHCTRVAVDVSLVAGPRPAFDVILERDGGPEPRPDLAIASVHEPTPVIGVVRAHPQPEYGPAVALEQAHTAVDRALEREEVAAVALDTRVDPREAGRRTSAQVEATFGRMDAVVTTRLHGLVTALKTGVPAVAIDPVKGGGKVAAQAGALAWPHVLRVDELADGDISRALEACLQADARRLAIRRRDEAASRVDERGDALVRTLTESRPG